MNEKELMRVRYENSPLVEVIFQLRFPTILSINSNQPVEFQERIRNRFPFFEEQIEEQSDLLINPKIKATALRKTGENKNYTFITEDNHTKINLTPSFIAVSTLRYIQWEDFKKIIEFAIPYFEEIYKPAFYTRVGLRYIDVITRSKLDLAGRAWTELMKPHVLGMITADHEAGVKSYLSETEYETKEAGVISKAHFEFVHVNDLPELSLLIDCDYYYLGIVRSDAMNGVSEKLHNASSQFIQTAITAELHEAMKPTEI